MDLNNDSTNDSTNDSSNDIYSPEELAWKLILDESINPTSIMTFADDNSKEIVFEILITIYLEMIFNYYKLKYLETTLDEEDNNKEISDNFENFKLDLTNINIHLLTNVFSEKFNKIKYILNVVELTQS